jgi:exopolyphosphatase/guanosine-5'-triphosphate,3'-diphosphate pyrophosphatase
MSRLESRDVAVIDVGSNSVRLVIYRLEGRAIWTVYNEKVLAGLGRELSDTNRLDNEGVEAALAALRRFRAVLDGAKPAHVYTAATGGGPRRGGRAGVRGPGPRRGRAEDPHPQRRGGGARLRPGRDRRRPASKGVVGDLGGSAWS